LYTAVKCASFEIRVGGSVLKSVRWARSRAGEARRSEPLTATTGPDNRALLNAGMVRHSVIKLEPVDAEPAV